MVRVVGHEAVKLAFNMFQNQIFTVPHHTTQALFDILLPRHSSSIFSKIRCLLGEGDDQQAKYIAPPSFLATPS